MAKNINLEETKKDFLKNYNNPYWSYVIDYGEFGLYHTLYKLAIGTLKIEKGNSVKIVDLRIFSGLGKNRIHNGLKLLEKYGWITVKRKRGKGKANKYTVHPIPEFKKEWLDKAKESKIEREAKVNVRLDKSYYTIDENGDTWMDRKARKKSLKKHKKKIKEYKKKNTDKSFFDNGEVLPIEERVGMKNKEKKEKKTNAFAEKGEKIKEKENKKKKLKAKKTKAVKTWFNQLYKKWYNVDYNPSNKKNYSNKCRELHEYFKEQFPEDDENTLMKKRVKNYMIWAFRNAKEYLPFTDTLYPGHLTNMSLLSPWFKRLGEKDRKKTKAFKDTKKEEKKKKENRKETGKTYKVWLNEDDNNPIKLYDYYIRGVYFMGHKIKHQVRKEGLYKKKSEKIRLDILKKLAKNNVLEYDENGEIWWSELPKVLLNEIHELLETEPDKSKKDVGIKKTSSSYPDELKREWK